MNAQQQLTAERLELALVDRYQHDPLAFIRNLIIPSATGPVLFDECMAPFQRECFDDVIPSLVAVRNGNMPERKRFWIERTKKASKDADMATMLLWLLAYPKRPTYFQVGAADKDQAAIIKERIEAILYYNQWLTDLIKVNKYQLANNSTPIVYKALYQSRMWL